MRISTRFLASLVPAALMSFALQAPVAADTIAVIGTGNVGGALGPEFAALGPHDSLRFAGA